ncbi:MAG: IS1595 family transposase [Stellaceae bacterium]
MQTPELLSDPVYHDEDAARAYIEEVRWPDFVTCPLCGAFDKINKLGGESMGPAWWYCGSCRGKFTVRVGMIFERSHIPLHKWLLAIRLMASSKKGISAHQLHRTLGITYKSAWFLGHRIRESMRETHPEPFGGEGKTVEIDETFVGGLEKNKHRTKRKHVGTGGAGKEAVFSLVERGGKVHSHHVPAVTAATLRPILTSQVHEATFVMTDEGATAKSLGRGYKKHGMVNHSIGEYVRGDIHTNTIEGYFSIFKRGINGVYHHVSQDHLKRYLAEFDFRYNERIALGVNDTERARLAVVGAEGKRLTYRRTRSQVAKGAGT